MMRAALNDFALVREDAKLPDCGDGQFQPGGADVLLTGRDTGPECPELTAECPARFKN